MASEATICCLDAWQTSIQISRCEAGRIMASNLENPEELRLLPPDFAYPSYERAEAIRNSWSIPSMTQRITSNSRFPNHWKEMLYCSSSEIPAPLTKARHLKRNGNPEHDAHSGKLRWNLKGVPLQLTTLFKGPHLRFHVSFFA